MRMPILSYFLFVGAALTGILLWLGNESQPDQPALTSSQTMGVPTFKPEPEGRHARVTTVNFAAAYGRPESKPIKAEATPRKQRAVVNPSEPPARNRYAEFPHSNLSIH